MTRPPQTSQRLGRLKRAARRLFWLGDVVSTGALADAAYPRKRRCTPRDYELLRDVLRRYADPVSRGGGRGRPLLWRLRNSGEKLEV